MPSPILGGRLCPPVPPDVTVVAVDDDVAGSSFCIFLITFAFVVLITVVVDDPDPPPTPPTPPPPYAVEADTVCWLGVLDPASRPSGGEFRNGEFDIFSLLWSPDVLRGETRPFCLDVSRQVAWIYMLEFLEGRCFLTCFAHLNPQLLHRSLRPLGPLLHSGVTLV
jgi:hypothetical protein